MEPSSVVISSIIKELVGMLSGIAKKHAQVPERIEAKIALHLAEVASWSGQIQHFGMSKPQETEEVTVELTIESQPRKFRKFDDVSNTLQEQDLLEAKNSAVILGQPGSGKTTTFKRLAQRLLTQDAVSASDGLQYPIVIRLRELNSMPSLVAAIATAVGLNYESKAVRIGNIEREVLFCGKSRLEDAVAEVLNETSPAIFIDGLDEVDETWRGDLETELIHLNRKVSNARIFLSCRSGDYRRVLDGFDVFEIEPLSDAQIGSIAEKWLRDPEVFLTQMRATAYLDLGNRPLFLITLIRLYQADGYLPAQSMDVVHRLLWLMLEKWDQQRSIRRASRYSSFNPDQKLRLLSALAYELTYEIKTTSFSTADLLRAYGKIHSRIGLPEGEAEQVVQEIESHTGIIMEGRPGKFEFCHLTLQEYLVGFYLVREPLSEHGGKYLCVRAAPVAMAVSMASNPSNWFSSVILNLYATREFVPPDLVGLLRRILLERPNFEVSVALGCAALKLEFLANESNDARLQAEMDEFVLIENVKPSILKAVEWFEVEGLPANTGVCLAFKRKYHFGNSYKFETPSGGLVRKLWFDGVSADACPI